MSYDSNVIQTASRQLEEQRTRRENTFAMRQAEIYSRIPRCREIDLSLRRSIPSVLSEALKQGRDPTEAVERLKEENLSLQRERASLLVDAGFSPDALTDRPICTKCGDSGWRGTSMCDCLKELCAKEQIRQLSSMLDLNGQSFAAFRLDYYPDEPVPGKNFTCRGEMEKIYKTCLVYAQKLPGLSVKNLFLSGEPGLGKTFLSASIAEVVAQRGYSVVYDTAANIFRQFEARKFERDSDAEDAARRYLNCDLLILDDLGSEMVTAFTESVLYEIINSRLISGKCTVISSNLDLYSGVRKKYSNMIYSRLSGEYRNLVFCGTDIRLLKRNQH